MIIFKSLPFLYKYKIIGVHTYICEIIYIYNVILYFETYLLFVLSSTDIYILTFNTKISLCTIVIMIVFHDVHSLPTQTFKDRPHQQVFTSVLIICDQHINKRDVKHVHSQLL